jgi:hypothetical protein
MKISKQQIKEHFAEMQTRVEGISARHLGPDSKPPRSMVRPDVAYLIEEIAFAWQVLGPAIEAADAMHARIQALEKQLAEATAPKVVGATMAQLKQLEGAARAQGRAR